MREVCLSWPGWSCERLPADGAAVWRLDGWPPEPAFSLTPEEESVEVLFCREGEASLKLAAGQRVSLGPGQVLFLTGRDAGSLCRFSPEYFRGILVWEKIGDILAALTALCPGLAEGPSPKGHGGMAADAALWCGSMFHTLDRLPAQKQGNYCAIKVLELLYLIHGSKASDGQRKETGYYDPAQLQAVQGAHDYMLEHLEEPLTIPQLAARFHLSGTMLKTCFRQIYGQPIHRYLLEQRMIKAAKLLSETQMTVLQVAEAVGYGSASQFSVTFKARYQMSPAQYRRAARKMSVSVQFCPKQNEKSP